MTEIRLAIIHYYYFVKFVEEIMQNFKVTGLNAIRTLQIIS